MKASAISASVGVEVAEDEEHVVRGNLENLGMEAVIEGAVDGITGLKSGGIDTEDREAGFGGDKAGRDDTFRDRGPVRERPARRRREKKANTVMAVEVVAGIKELKWVRDVWVVHGDRTRARATDVGDAADRDA